MKIIKMKIVETRLLDLTIEAETLSMVIIAQSALLVEKRVTLLIHAFVFINVKFVANMAILQGSAIKILNTCHNKHHLKSG